jgi:hypothetical protein
MTICVADYTSYLEPQGNKDRYIRSPDNRDIPSRIAEGFEAPVESLAIRILACQMLKTVRRGKAAVHSGRQTRPGTGSLHPVAIEATAEVTKPLEPSV